MSLQRGLLAGAIAMLMLLPGAVVAQTPDLAKLRSRALELVNETRRAQNLPPLESGENLNEAAQRHADDMLRRDYYAHVSPEGDSVQDRFIEAGGSRWQLVAENIARCQGCATPPDLETVERMQQGWMNSPPHRENILKRGLDRFGFGVAAGDGTLYAVQTFAGAGMPRGLQAGETAEPLSQGEVALRALETINRVRTKNGLDPLKLNDGLTPAARSLLPQEGAELGLGDGALLSRVPSGGTTWRSVEALAAECGGCGSEPTGADVRSFVDQWLDDPQYREMLLSSAATHLGFAMQAYGNGRKSAVAILGGHG